MACTETYMTELVTTCKPSGICGLVLCVWQDSDRECSSKGTIQPQLGRHLVFSWPHFGGYMDTKDTPIETLDTYLSL